MYTGNLSWYPILSNRIPKHISWKLTNIRTNGQIFS